MRAKLAIIDEYGLLDPDVRIAEGSLPSWLSEMATGDLAGAVLEKVSKGDLVFNVKDYGAKGDGVTDDLAAINAAIAAVGAVTDMTGMSSRYRNKPTLYFPNGVYRITAALTKIMFRALRITGAGATSTAIMFDSAADVPVFEFGTFTATPADVFTGDVQDASLHGIRIQHKNPGVQGSRLAQGIRISGGGSLVLNDVAVLGFKYGINSPYGGDFNNYTNVVAEYCDVGVYQGPGGQQFLATNLNVFLCREGVVMDRWGHAHFTMPVFNSSGIAGLVLEAVSGTTTRQLTSFNPSGTTMASKLVLNTPWFEGNAGNLGDNYIPLYYVEIRNNGTDAYRGITINDPFIMAGKTVTRETLALVGNTGTYATQWLAINRPIVGIGTLAEWVVSAGNQTTVSTPYPLPSGGGPAITGAVQLVTQGRVSGSQFPYKDTIENREGTEGIQHEYNVGGELRFGFKSGATYYQRAGFDIQNRALILDDFTNTYRFKISRASTMPTTGSYGAGSFVHNTAPTIVNGKVLLGWKRLTSGAAHVADTDWVTVYGSTSNPDVLTSTNGTKYRLTVGDDGALTTTAL